MFKKNYKTHALPDFWKSDFRDLKKPYNIITLYSIFHKSPNAIFFFKQPSLMYFLFFNFQDFILCVELIILQSSFIRIKKKKPKYFLK